MATRPSGHPLTGNPSNIFLVQNTDTDRKAHLAIHERFSGYCHLAALLSEGSKFKIHSGKICLASLSGPENTNSFERGGTKMGSQKCGMIIDYTVYPLWTQEDFKKLIWRVIKGETSRQWPYRPAATRELP